jgi:hypothetical protein
MSCCKPSLSCDNFCDFIINNYNTSNYFAKLLQWYPNINELINTIENAQIIIPTNSALTFDQTLLNFPFPYTVEDVLLYHLVPTFEKGKQETLLKNRFVVIKDKTINDANILRSFVICNCEGKKNIIHQIDQLLFPIVK